MFNLANNLTLCRILTVPILVVLMSFPGKMVMIISTVVFILASLTDLLDGYVARQHSQVTTIGKFLDPLADKLLISSVLIMLVDLDWLPAWIAVVIICRELTVTGLRAIAADKGLVIAADKFGKLKTIVQSLALVPLILHYPFMGMDLEPYGMKLMYLAVLLTIFSGINYLYNFYKKWLD